MKKDSILVSIDKRGSINLPARVRRKLGLDVGSHLELEVLEGGAIVLHPVYIYRGVHLSQSGLEKIKQARDETQGH